MLRDGVRNQPSGDIRRPLAITLLMALAAGCGSTVTPQHSQAVAKVQDLGGQINFKRGGYEVDLRNTAVADKDLACLKDITNLKNVNLVGTRVTDQAIEHLKPIATLEFVWINRTFITREGAAELQKALPKADVER